MLNWLSRASIGLSTMVDEHFGINVVEFMVCPVPRLVLNRHLTFYRTLGRRSYPCDACLGRPSQRHCCPVQRQAYRFVVRLYHNPRSHVKYQASMLHLPKHLPRRSTRCSRSPLRKISTCGIVRGRGPYNDFLRKSLRRAGMLAVGRIGYSVVP